MTHSILAAVSPQDVTLTVSLILACGLVARLFGDLTGLPEIVLMVGLGVLVGPSALDVANVPVDSLGTNLILSVGVGFILFYGGLGLSVHVLHGVSTSLTLLVLLGVIVTATITGLAASLVFGLPVEVGLLIGAVLAPTDPAILIPLFGRMNIRPKVAQTVIAESAFNDPTGAILALALAGVVSAATSRTRRRSRTFCAASPSAARWASPSDWCSPSRCPASGPGSGASRRRSRHWSRYQRVTSPSRRWTVAGTWEPSWPD